MAEGIDDLVLGQMLLEQGMVSQEQLDHAFKETTSDRTLAAVLIETEIVSQGQIEEVSQQQTVKAKAAKAPIHHDATKVRPVAPPADDVPADVREMIKNPDYCFDKWVLLGMLGKGGMGEVWKAYQRDLKRYVAIKFLESRDGDVDLERFFREAQTAASLNHPNITSLYELNRHGNRYYIVMELVDGVTLQKHMGKIPFQKAARIIRQAAIALEYAHKQGIVHRDIKPQNIMVAKNGRVYVMDFGLAKQTKQQSGHTVAGMILGTPAYMSPEQTEGKADKLDKRTDVYSLGGSLYALVTGKSPASGPSAMATMQKVYSGDIAPPRQINPKIPVELEAIIQKAMDREKTGRYQSCAAFAEDLRRFLDGEPISAATPSFGKSLRHTLRRNSGLVMSVGVALLVMIVGVTAFMLARGGNNNGGGTANADDLKAKEEELRRQKEEIEIRRELEKAQQAVLDAEHVLVLDNERWEKLVRHADAAFGEASNVLKKHPKASDAMALQGRALALKLDYAGAESKLKDAVAAGPNSEAAHREISKLYWLWAEELDTFRTWTGQTASAAGDELRKKGIEPLRRWKTIAIEKEDQLLADALVAYFTRDFQRSADSAKAAIDAKANRWEAHYLRAQALRRQGRPVDAVRDIQAAERLQKSNPLVLQMAAGTHVHLYNNAPAIPILDALMRLRPDFVPALCLRAQLLVKNNRVGEAVKDADAAIRFAPRKPDGYIARGIAMSAMGKVDEARTAFDRAIEHDPKHGWAYALRAMPRLQQRDVDGALSDIERSIDLDPTAPEGYYQRAMLRVQTGRVDEGIADAAKAASIDLNYASQHIELLFGLRKFKDAAMAGAQYKEKIPNDYKIHLMTGMALYEAEDYLGALDSLNNSEKHLGSFAPARHYRGMSYFKLKQYEEALHDLDWCWVVDRGNGRPNPQVIHMVAACRFFLKQYKECLKVIDELIKVDARMKDHPDVVVFTRECKKALGE